MTLSHLSLLWKFLAFNWSPFAPRALYSIADCTFAKSGASTKMALRNLLELSLH